MIENHTGVIGRRRREKNCLWPCLSSHKAQIDCTESLSTQAILICSLMSGDQPLSRGREPDSGRTVERARCRPVVRVTVTLAICSVLSETFLCYSQPIFHHLILSHLRPHQSSPQAIVQACKEAHYSHDHTGVLDNHTGVHKAHHQPDELCWESTLEWMPCSHYTI